MDQYGYGSGDPATEIGLQQAKLRAVRMANNEGLYNFQGQISKDQGLANPDTAAALMALSQQTGGNAPATAPLPGQSSAPQGGPGPGQPMSQLQQPTGGGPQLTRMPGGSALSTPPPATSFSLMNGQGGTPMNPNQPAAPQSQAAMGGAQQPAPQAPPQQAFQAMVQQYPTTGALINAIQQANPGIRPAGLSKLIQTVLPMYQNRQSSMDPYKQLQEQQRLGIGAGAPDPEVVSNAVAQIKSTGNYTILSRMPAPFREAVVAQLGGFDAGNAQVNLTGRKAEASSTGRQVGPLNVAGNGFAEIMPDALAASAKVPRDSWKFANQVDNWLKEQSNDPDFAAFQAFNLGLVREYARAMGGTVSAQNKAESALGTAKNEAAYDAAVKALYREIQDAQKGGKKALRDVSAPDSDDNGIQVDGPPPSGGDDGWGEMKVQ